MDRSTHSLLVEALSRALLGALRLADREDRNGTGRTAASDTRTVLEVEEAVAAFKRLWIYADEETLRAPADSACGSHLVLFFKNLSVTDVASAELLALIRTHTTVAFPDEARSEPGGESVPSSQAQKKPGIHFFSNDEYTAYLRNIIRFLRPQHFETRAAADTFITALVQRLVTDHGDVLSRTVVLDQFFTCALVHVPRALRCDFQAVVAESGYIQSAGYSLYVRRAERADQRELRAELDRYTVSHPRKVFLTPYALEYFAANQAGRASISTRNGLDGVQFNLSKHYVSGFPLNDVLLSFAEKNPLLHIATGEQRYDFERRDSVRKHGCSKDATIWIISDYRPVATSASNYSRSGNNYLFVYAQYLANDSQLVLLKERKPAWVASVTLPHTLSAAMVNIARDCIDPACSTPLVVDPFCGSGTTLFDAKARLPSATVLGIDLNPMMPLMVEDNAHFLSLSTREKRAVEGQLLLLAEEIVAGEIGAPDTIGEAGDPDRQNEDGWGGFLNTAIGEAIAELAKALPQAASDEPTAPAAAASDHGLDPLLIERLENRSREERLVFYLVWRALSMARYSIADDDRRAAIITAELRRTIVEFQRLLNIQKARSTGSAAEHFEIAPGEYSNSTRLSPAFFAALDAGIHQHGLTDPAGIVASRPGKVSVLVANSTVALKQLEGMVDVIIGDPPYWFNTGGASLFGKQEFYGDFLRSAALALKPGGQLMITLPEFSKTGRQIPFFQTRGAATRQVMAALEGAGRRVISISRTYPGRKTLFSPPFYWQSATALSRSVLWFTVGR